MIELLRIYSNGFLENVMFEELTPWSPPWADGKIDPRRLKAIGRVGANLYSKPGEIFELKHTGVKP